MQQVSFNLTSELVNIICSLKGVEPKNIAKKDYASFIEDNFHLVSIALNCDDRVRELSNVIIDYSNQEFDSTAIISDNNDELDGLASGINMLGEELAATTISLREKEILLKEIHHRVKNNLQMVSSLISLQSGFIKDKDTVDKFKDCQSRIKSMALVHEKLYQTNDLSNIELSDYLQTLVHDVDEFHKGLTPNVLLELNIKNGVITNIDQCVLCGLIVNELLTNCYKHAFTSETKAPLINVQLSSFQDDITISVQDNGKGIKGGLPIDTSNSLGMLVITSLIDQLEAKSASNTDNGTQFTFTFRKSASR